ncbi:MAG: TIGR00725 family protein [Longimicrobiales bacterium]
MNTRPLRIAVCCAGLPDQEYDQLAEQVGALIARANAVLLCGGLGGAMTAVARGAAQAGGLTVGILPGANAQDANEHITLPLPTGLGEARNVVLVRSADAVIAIGGEWGTLSEIALARKIGRPVVLLRPTLAASLQLPTAASPEQAVNLAVSMVQR